MTAKRDVNMESQLPQGMAGEKLRDLERGPITQRIQEDVPAQAPHFVTQIAEVAIEEGENVHFECRVEPKNDTNLRVDWYHNGKLLPNGHRFRTMFELGFVSLDILYAYPEDAGEYLCRAYNAIGEDKTKAVLTCKSILRHVRTERWKMINFLCFFFLFFLFFSGSYRRRPGNHHAEPNATRHEEIWNAASNGGGPQEVHVRDFPHRRGYLRRR